YHVRILFLLYCSSARHYFVLLLLCLFFNAPATTDTYTLSLHDALPISQRSRLRVLLHFADNTYNFGVFVSVWQTAKTPKLYVLSDRKSTRLNSSHGSISYAVFCLKKKM